MIGESESERTQRDLDILKSLVEMIRSQLGECWQAEDNSGMDAESLITVKVSLNRVGTIRKAYIVERERMGEDAVFRAQANGAHKAILTCSPFRLPPDQYNYWRELTLKFHLK